MKNLLYIGLALVFTNVLHSQNSYDVYVIEKNKKNTILDVIEDNGRAQTQLQNRYNYNYERFSQAFNDINTSLYSLNISKQKKDRIFERWNIYIDKLNNLKLNFTSNTEITNIINHSYNVINKIIYEEN
jgi:hypothetical protein